MVYTRHARCRMDCRHITSKEIQEILDDGHINYTKSEPDGQPDPNGPWKDSLRSNQHLRIIIAPESDKLVLLPVLNLGWNGMSL